MQCKNHDKPVLMTPLSSYFNDMTLAYLCLSCGDIVKDEAGIEIFKKLFVKKTKYNDIEI